MRFSFKTLLVGVACLVFATPSGAAYCGKGPWNPDTLEWTGGSGGGEFCETKYQAGIVMSGVEVWSDKKGIVAVQFGYSDGSLSRLYGRTGGETMHDKIEWDPATDGIKKLVTWGDGRASSLGRLVIETNTGKALDVGRKPDASQSDYPIQVHSGILLATFGASGTRIDRLGFAFLRSKVKKVSIDEVRFAQTPDELNKKREGLQTVMLDFADHTNNHDKAEETFTFGKSELKKSSKSYSVKTAFSSGIKQAIEVSGELLGIGAKSTTELSWGVTRENSEDSVQEKQTTLTYSTATKLAPGQRVFCRAFAMTGSYKGSFTATVNILLEDGYKFSFKSEGVMEQVQWSEASSECDDQPFPDKKRALKFIA